MSNTTGVTAELLRKATAAAGIERIPHHDCGICGYETAYIVWAGELFFDPGCHCSGGAGWEPRSWEAAAAWVNMQSDPEIRGRLLAAFGVVVG